MFSLGQLAKSNAEQVAKARQILEGLGLELATPDEAREVLHLKGADKVGFYPPRRSVGPGLSGMPGGADRFLT